MAKLKITEADVQRTVVEFLQWDGWRAIRTDPVSDRARGKGFGEVGMPDYLFIRYRFTLDPKNCYRLGESEVLWIEFKRKRGKRTLSQVQWHSLELRRGALVLVVDDIDGFRNWYAKSGLQRRLEIERRRG